MNIKITISIFSLFLIVSCGQSVNQESLREIEEGSLIGMEGENNTFVWKGIPFAQPPVGDLRWKAPLDASAWEGTYEAIDFKSACFQGSNRIQGDNEDKWSGSEDCLYLNIWTPMLTQDQVKGSQDKLPVMMWIHGGGNTTGSAHIYDPSLLVSKHKVVVVTIQYRMGPL